MFSHAAQRTPSPLSPAVALDRYIASLASTRILRGGSNVRGNALNSESAILTIVSTYQYVTAQSKQNVSVKQNMGYIFRFRRIGGAGEPHD
jgi:hypothetical protein